MGILDNLLTSVVWNSNFEDDPAGGDSPSFGDDAIRESKEAVRERFEKEHKINLLDGTVANDGWHKRGSAISYYQAAAPTTRPDGVTALTDDDAGRFWVRSTDYAFFKYLGTSVGWVSETTLAMRITIQGSLYVSANIIPAVIIPQTFVVSKVLSKLGTAPTGTDDVRFDLLKNGSNSIFSAGYVELGTTDVDTETSFSAYNSLSSGDYLTVSIEQVGDIIGGADLSITLLGGIE